MKITKNENFRLVVEIDERAYSYLRNDQDRLEKALLGECDTIKSQIRRHIDGAGNMYPEWDTSITCSHCGYNWEEDENGVPVCCQEAIDEYNAPKTEPIL